MTTPVPTRFSDEQLRLIDELVDLGAGPNRSEVVRLAVEHFASEVRRARIGQSIADSYRERPQGPDDDALGLANALAMTAAEPW